MLSTSVCFSAIQTAAIKKNNYYHYFINAINLITWSITRLFILLLLGLRLCVMAFSLSHNSTHTKKLDLPHNSYTEQVRSEITGNVSDSSKQNKYMFDITVVNCSVD